MLCGRWSGLLAVVLGLAGTSVPAQVLPGAGRAAQLGQGVEVMGRGEQFTPDPVVGNRSIIFGFRAATGTAPVKGMVTLFDRLYQHTFSGHVQTVEVTERAADGTPKVVKLSGVASERHMPTPFTCTVVAPSPGDKGQFGLSVQGGYELELPVLPIAGGYLWVTPIAETR